MEILPQLIVIIICIADLLCGAHLHNRLKVGRHKAWFGLVALTIESNLLLWGDFFDQMNPPQITYVVIRFSYLCVICYQHGTPRKGRYNIGFNILSAVVTLGILAWGGFFHYIIK